jgi:hypothetical protein
MSKEPSVFQSKWPEGIEPLKRYTVMCDDDGCRCNAHFSVLVDQQGDVFLSMSAYHDEERTTENINPFPCVRIRTGFGGGRMRRTRQALLWLAKAIDMDTRESPESIFG